MTQNEVNVDTYLLETGTLQVATLDNFVPVIFKDEEQQWRGFEVDILNKIAERLDVKLKFDIYPYEGIWTLPKQKKADVAAAGISITDRRIEDGAIFTEPYLFIKQSLLIKKEQKDEIKNIDDTKDKTVGIVPGTTGATYAQEHAPEETEIKTFDNEKVMLKALEKDQIDAVSRGEPGNRYQAKQDSKYIITGLSGHEEKFALAVADENKPLLNIINQQIKAMKESGEIDKFYQKWFK